MTILEAVILGVIQGLTEFLPISSSGHLVIGESLLGLSTPGMSFEIWLHFGTLLAVLIYFRRKLMELMGSLIKGGEDKSVNKNRSLLAAIVVGTIPAIIIGLLLKSSIESVFESPRATAFLLIITGVVLLLTLLARDSGRKINIPRGLAIGLAQSAAILPGISRSGSTIACAMFLGVKPSVAAEFSFLLAAPIIALAFGYDLVFSEAALFASDQIVVYLVGTMCAFVVGILAIHYLLKIIRTGRFYLFGFYCLVAGALSLILLG
jgi:undecaprenyl-diphosphatase